MEKLEHQDCPFCRNKTLTLTEDEQDIPYFGKCYLFSVSCKACGYHQADVESEEELITLNAVAKGIGKKAVFLWRISLKVLSISS